MSYPHRTSNLKSTSLHVPTPYHPFRLWLKASPPISTPCRTSTHTPKRTKDSSPTSGQSATRRIPHWCTRSPTAMTRPWCSTPRGPEPLNTDSGARNAPAISSTHTCRQPSAIYIYLYAVYTSSVQSMFIFQNCLCETAAVRRHYDLYPDTVHFPSALKRMEMEFVKMGLRGLSVLFASGDYGAGNFDTGSSRCSKAWPDWPASSPFITSVGGTQLSTEYLPLCTQSSVRIYCR